MLMLLHPWIHNKEMGWKWYEAGGTRHVLVSDAQPMVRANPHGGGYSRYGVNLSEGDALVVGLTP